VQLVVARESPTRDFKIIFFFFACPLITKQEKQEKNVGKNTYQPTNILRPNPHRISRRPNSIKQFYQRVNKAQRLQPNNQQQCVGNSLAPPVSASASASARHSMSANLIFLSSHSHRISHPRQKKILTPDKGDK